MADGQGTNNQPNGPVAAVTAAIRQLAYAVWATSREAEQEAASSALFERAYLGHYSSVDAYVIRLIDSYQLDAKLDTTIAQPFRRHVDIDTTTLGQDLVAGGTLYTLPAVPVGVWVFNGEIE